MLNSKVYDVLKWVSLVALPAIATCAVSIMTLVGVDGQTIAMVAGICTAVDTCLGTLLGVSSIKYQSKKEGE